MIKIGKILNKLPSDSVFWIFPIRDLFVFQFVSNFDIRILDLLCGLLDGNSSRQFNSVRVPLVDHVEDCL